MDEQNQVPIPAEEEKKYPPRPAWQVWAARIGLVIFVVFLVMFYVKVARGTL